MKRISYVCCLLLTIASIVALAAFNVAWVSRAILVGVIAKVAACFLFRPPNRRFRFAIFVIPRTQRS